MEEWINKTISLRTKKGFNYKGTLNSFNKDLKLLTIFDFKTQTEFCIPLDQLEEFKKIDEEE